MWGPLLTSMRSGVVVRSGSLVTSARCEVGVHWSQGYAHKDFVTSMCVLGWHRERTRQTIAKELMRPHSPRQRPSMSIDCLHSAHRSSGLLQVCFTHMANGQS